MPGWSYILVLPVVVYLLVLLRIYRFQSSILFQPDRPGRELEATPDSLGLHYEDVHLVTGDGACLHGWYVPGSSHQERGVVLFLHGNAGNISHRLERLELLHDLGFSVLIIDYRGYGRSSGHPTEEGLYHDAETAWHHLLEERGYAPQDIVVFGHSLGGGVATHLANRHRPRALVVENSFVSVPAAAAEHYPWLPVRWLTRFRFPSARNLAGVSCPVLIAHARDDEVIAFRHGQILFAAASHPKRFVELEGDHDRGFLATGERYVRELEIFLDGLPAGPGT